MQFQLKKQGDECTLLLQGKLTFAEHGAFTDLIGKVQSSQPSALAVDLSGLERIDSAGLGMLILLRDLSQSNGFALSFSGATGQVLKILQLSEFQTVLKIEP